jgi:hypothetical protein
MISWMKPVLKREALIWRWNMSETTVVGDQDYA